MAVTPLLKAEFKQAGLDLFNALVAQGGNEKYTTKTIIDKITGNKTAGVDYPVRMVREKIKANETLPDKVELTDTKFLLLQDELAVTPLNTGFITYQTATFQLIAIETDPADVVWTCYGRLI